MRPHRSFVPLLLQWERDVKQANSVDEPALIALFDAYAPAPPPALTNDALRAKAAALLQTDGTGPYIAHSFLLHT